MEVQAFLIIGEIKETIGHQIRIGRFGEIIFRCDIRGKLAIVKEVDFKKVRT